MIEQGKRNKETWILFATILASGMAFLDSSVVNIAIPTIQKTFQTQLTGIQWVVNSYMLLLCSLILISGTLGDKFGRKRIFSYGILLFTIASLLCGLSHTISQLIFFRGLQGIGGAMMIPGSLSIINASFEQHVRGRAIGIWSGFAGGVAALGPFVGGWLVQTLGWQSIFYINIPFGIIAFLLTIRHIPESKNPQEHSIDIPGALLLFLSLLGITYALIVGPVAGITNPLILISSITGILAAILFLFREKTTAYPLVPFRIFISPLVTGANIATAFLYFAISGVIFFLVLNFQQIQHYSPIQAGLGMLPSVLLITFLSRKGGSIADRIGARIPMIVGPIIVAAGTFSFVFSGVHAKYATQFLPGLLLIGVGMALVIAPLTKSALAVQQNYSGAASGVNNAVARIAGLLAVALLGGIMLFLFRIHLTNTLHSQRIVTTQQQQQIVLQENKLGGIDIPKEWSNQQRTIVQNAIDKSFVSGFRWTMGLTALLGLLSSIISFFTIHSQNLESFPTQEGKVFH